MLCWSVCHCVCTALFECYPQQVSGLDVTSIQGGMLVGLVGSLKMKKQDAGEAGSAETLEVRDLSCRWFLAARRLAVPILKAGYQTPEAPHP